MSEPSTSAPVPSRHVFLHQLSKLPTGAKVRFLCCVRDYDILQGHLHVEHAYPTDAIPIPQAVVDVNIVLETVEPKLLTNGTWLNVIGYVQGNESGERRKRNQSRSVQGKVQAVLVWDAGNIRSQDYGRVMEQHKAAMQTVKQLEKSYG